MTKWDDTARLIQAHFTGDDEQFKTIANIHCAHAPDNRKVRAGQLRALLGTQRVVQLPTQLSNLLLATPPVQRDTLLLRPEINLAINESLTLLRHRHNLTMNGLTADTRLLFSGPPGCGKTSLAAAIATELGLNCYTLSLGNVIASHMGETGGNLAKVLRDVDRFGVLVLDEIDAIAACRNVDGSASAQEHNRIVNTLCIELDRFTGIVVATTNMAAVLDPAIARRFERRIDFGPVEWWQKRELAQRWVSEKLATTIANEHSNLADVAVAAKRVAALRFIEELKSAAE